MATFTDAAGREWKLEIPNFRAVTRLREETGFDLNRVAHAEDGLADLIYGDAERVVKAGLFLVTGPAPGSADEFAGAIDRDALERLRLAVAGATFDFFHHRRAAGMTARLRTLMTPGGSTGSAGTSPGPAA